MDGCAEYAPALKAEVVVVHSVDIPVFVSSEFGIGPIAMPMPPELNRDELRRAASRSGGGDELAHFWHPVGGRWVD